MEYSNSMMGPRTTATSLAEGRLKPMVGGVGRMGRGLGRGIRRSMGKKMDFLKKKIGEIKSKSPEGTSTGNTVSTTVTTRPERPVRPDLPTGKPTFHSLGTMKIKTPEFPAMPKMPDLSKVPQMPEMPKMPNVSEAVNKAYEKAKAKFKSTL